MKRIRFAKILNVKVSENQRAAIENRAEAKELSIAEVTRDLLDAGMKARGLEC